MCQDSLEAHGSGVRTATPVHVRGRPPLTAKGTGGVVLLQTERF